MLITAGARRRQRRAVLPVGGERREGGHRAAGGDGHGVPRGAPAAAPEADEHRQAGRRREGHSAQSSGELHQSSRNL